LLADKDEVKEGINGLLGRGRWCSEWFFKEQGNLGFARNQIF
jgi:hypothetical protein